MTLVGAVAVSLPQLPLRKDPENCFWEKGDAQDTGSIYFPAIGQQAPILLGNWDFLASLTPLQLIRPTLFKSKKGGLIGRPSSFYLPHFCLIRSTASLTFSLSPKALRRKKPSPEGPKPEPGVPTTWHSLSNLSKNSQELSPPGVLSQM